MGPEEFVVGDVVKLKSGGRKMTVAATEGRDLEAIDGKAAKCVWHDVGGALHLGIFDMRTLKLEKGMVA